MSALLFHHFRFLNEDSLNVWFIVAKKSLANKKVNFLYRQFRWCMLKIEAAGSLNRRSFMYQTLRRHIPNDHVS
jgi:hypothetical protein